MTPETGLDFVGYTLFRNPISRILRKGGGYKKIKKLYIFMQRILVGASNFAALKAQETLIRYANISISGFRPNNRNKSVQIISEFKKVLNPKASFVEIIIEIPGNMLFPGFKKGSCYIYARPSPSIEDVVKSLENFVMELKKCCDKGQKINITFIPCLGRRKFKCHRKCEKCISFPYFAKTLKKLERALVFHNIGGVVSYLEVANIVFGKNYVVKRSKIVGQLTTALLRCNACRKRKYGKKFDCIHHCCSDTRQLWASVIMQCTNAQLFLGRSSKKRASDRREQGQNVQPPNPHPEYGHSEKCPSD